MSRTAAGLLAALLLLALPAAPALAGSTIDTTGFATNTSYPITDLDPVFGDKTSQETAQTFLVPAGAQAVTRVSVLAAAAANQPVWLKLYALTGGVPDAELKSETATLASGGRTLRSYEVAWPVSAGTSYAFAIGTLPVDVTGNASLTLPNVGGADGRNVYADGQVFTRQLLSPPVPKPWNGDPAIDVKFKLDFDGGVSTGGSGDGGTPTTPTTPTTPVTSTPTTPSAASPTLPAKPLSLKAAKGRPKIPANFACTGAALSSCSLTVTPPKGARSVRVDVLRGGRLVASGASAKGKAGTGKRRAIRLAAKGALARGLHTVRLTVVTAKGRTLRQTATFTA